MSVAAAAPSSVRHYARVVRHFASTRGVEVCVLQASPLLGAVLGGLGDDARSLGRLAVLVLGSIALTAHVFVLNDWAGYESDAHDRRRARLGAEGNGIGRDEIARVAVALLLLAALAFAAVGIAALLIGAAIAALGVVYSSSPHLGRSTPVAASLNHVAGGALHFLLGYTLLQAMDGRGVALSLFFGLVFAAGHLNQEVRDHDVDRANGIRTSAVAFGCRRAFVASLCLFTVAYALIVVLAAVGELPKVVLVAGLAWALQAWWSLEALRRGLGVATALWMQRRYRLLFALVGVAMLLR